MNCIAGSCQPDASVPPLSEKRPQGLLPLSVRRKVAIQYLRAASRIAVGRKRESLRRRAADLILPRSR